LLNTDPRIALLSFSTKGSAKHKNTDKILSALKKLKSLEPELLVDGELQFDAAIDSAVGEIKAPGSKGGRSCKRYDFSKFRCREYSI
jgi:phosphate acetyltransferase